MWPGMSQQELVNIGCVGNDFERLKTNKNHLTVKSTYCVCFSSSEHSTINFWRLLCIFLFKCDIFDFSFFVFSEVFGSILSIYHYGGTISPPKLQSNTGFMIYVIDVFT